MRSTMPTWLTSKYQHLHECLIDKMKKSMLGLPKCYQHNSFYDEVGKLYLAVRSTFQLSASLFHQLQFFIWLPYVLIDKIPVWPIARLVVSPSRACASTFRNMALLHILIVWLILTGMCILWATDTCVVTRTVKRCSSAEVHLFSICYCPHCETNLSFASPIDAGSLYSLPHSSVSPSVLVFCQNSSPQ